MSDEANSPSEVLERSLTSEIKLYYDLVRAESQPAPLLIALHGYGASKRQMMREARLIAPANFAIAALQGPHQHLKEPKEPGGPLRFGFGWLTNFHPEESVALHHQALLRIIDSAIKEGLADSKRIFLLGFSQTCALNYRFAFTHPETLCGVIGICGGLPGDWQTSQTFKQTNASVFHLSGNRDEFYSPARTADFEKLLRARATEVEFRRYDAGHEIVQSMREDIREWLREKSTLL
jgi:phospholipase/carboxylesterase